MRFPKSRVDNASTRCIVTLASANKIGNFDDNPGPSSIAACEDELASTDRPVHNPRESPLNRLATVAKGNSHHYRPLPSRDSIRVIELQPGKQDETILFSLEVISDYREAVAYHALSYCWGDASDTVPVLCEGRPFSITKNLHGALRQLRAVESIRRLWVDAICINQHDTIERNQQVTIMKQIYVHAQRVDVWLGPSDSDTADTIKLIETIAAKCCASMYGSDSRSWWLQKLKKEEDPRSVLPENPLLGLPDASSNSWEILARFYSREWFTRVWVIQEVQASLEVWLICGKLVVEWELVALVAAWIDFARLNLQIRCFSRTSKGIQQVRTMRGRLARKQDVPFLRALDRVRLFNSTDPRDKVFSMLQYHLNSAPNPTHEPLQRLDPNGDENLFTPRTDHSKFSHLGIQVDYNKTTSEVYREVAVRSIQQHGSLEVMYYVTSMPTKATRHSSWIPRWDVYNVYSRSIIPQFLYSASAGRQAILSNVLTEAIVLRGLRIDTIANTNSALPIGHRQEVESSSLIGPLSRLGTDWLMCLSRILVQDTGRVDYSSMTWKRARGDLDTHFAEFASCMVEAIGDEPADCFVSLSNYYCDRCGERIVRLWKPMAKTVRRYGCDICKDGDFDMCLSCYESGERCFDSSHELRLRSLMSLWYAHDEKIFDRLRKSASTSSAEAFRFATKDACWGRIFFSGKEGWVGSAPQAAQPGDTVAVLLGGRVPFILRKQGDHYRLVGSCYVHGLMDGEAIEMCEGGVLAEEEFELR